MGLDVTGIGAVADFAGKLIDKIIPDAGAAAAAKADVVKMQESGELANMAGQLAVDEEEAKSTNWFVAGWRPFVGWTCGLGLLYVSLLEPLMRFIAMAYGYKGAFPVIDTSLTMQVLLGMLGLGAMRSYEKVNNSEGNR